MFLKEIEKLVITAVKQPVKFKELWLVDIHHYDEKSGPHIKCYEFEEYERAVAAYDASHDEMLRQHALLGRKAQSLIDVVFYTLMFCALVLFLVTAFQQKAHSSDSDDIVKERIVNAIIGEAEGEPYQGKLAIACAIQNRVQTFGSFDKAMRGVYGERAPRVVQRKYSSRIFVQAVRAYEESLNVGTCDFVEGADHWEGTAFKAPSWSSKMKTTVVVGRQRFYKGN